MKRKLRMGMVGGGRGAFIGGVHRIAATFDGQVELVAGAFSSDPEKSVLSGRDLFVPKDRCYGSYQKMAAEEAKLPEGERIDFVVVVTPNFLHFDAAKTFLKAGFHVVSDKPMTVNLKQARELRRLAKNRDRIFALTHNYAGYPLVKEARERVRAGKLGDILKIVAEYPQGWLLDALEQEGQKQASWRTDPDQAGASCCVADIGTHAEHLGRYITGLEIDALCAEFTTFVPGRELEDDANILIRYKGGAKGILCASQISAGEENGPLIRIYGTKAGLEWRQPEPNQMTLKYNERPDEVLRPSNPYLSKAARRFCRVPPGHPEAFFEAFANVYAEALRAIRDRVEGKKPPKAGYDYPDVEDGVYGMAFIETAVKSAQSERKWTKFPSV